MVQSTPVSSKQETTKERASVYKFGMTAQSILVVGNMERLLEWDVSFLLMVMPMKESGKRVKLTVLASTIILMALDIKANGLKTNKMVKAVNSGLTEAITKENIVRARNTVLENSHGLTEHFILESGKVIK